MFHEVGRHTGVYGQEEQYVSGFGAGDLFGACLYNTVFLGKGLQKSGLAIGQAPPIAFPIYHQTIVGLTVQGNAVFGEVDAASIDYYFVAGGVCGYYGASHGYRHVVRTTRTDTNLHDVVKDKIAGPDFLDAGEVLHQAATGRIADREDEFRKSGPVVCAKGCQQAEVCFVYGPYLLYALGAVRMPRVGEEAEKADFAGVADFFQYAVYGFLVVGFDASAMRSYIYFYEDTDGMA